MRETERIVDQLQRAFAKNAWHGPALLEVLENISAEDASAKPLEGSHSIWEIVVHLTAWKNIVRQRLTSPTPILPSDAEDWPQLPAQTSENWTVTLEKLRKSQDDLVAAVRAMDPTELMRMVAGKDYSMFVMLLGVAQHDDYHGGQISLLKRAARRVASHA